MSADMVLLSIARKNIGIRPKYNEVKHIWSAAFQFLRKHPDKPHPINISIGSWPEFKEQGYGDLTLEIESYSYKIGDGFCKSTELYYSNLYHEKIQSLEIRAKALKTLLKRIGSITEEMGPAADIAEEFARTCKAARITEIWVNENESTFYPDCTWTVMAVAQMVREIRNGVAKMQDEAQAQPVAIAA